MEEAATSQLWEERVHRSETEVWQPGLLKGHAKENKNIAHHEKIQKFQKDCISYVIIILLYAVHESNII